MRWWRLFINKITGRRSDPDGVAPRRREAERYQFAVEIAARCSSWPKFVEMFTGDVSVGGMFVPTDQTAEIGETIEVELTLPNLRTFKLAGEVVNTINQEQAALQGKGPGLGIKLRPLEGEEKQLFEQLLATAKESAPMPPKPAITPTGSIRLSAVESAVTAADAKLSIEDFEPLEIDVDVDEAAAEPPAPPAPPEPPPKPLPRRSSPARRSSR